MKNLLYILLSLLLFAAPFGCGRSAGGEEFRSGSGVIWNTTWRATFRGDPALLDSVAATLKEVGNSLNVFDSTSLVSRVNREDSVPVNTDFIRVYVMSQKINKLSGGDFDPTLGPLIAAWGFGPGHQLTPDTARIDSLLAITGIGKTHLYRDSLVKDTLPISFNFSAIAKGYGADRVGEMFRRNNVEDFLIEIGGEIFCGGRSPSGDDWRISVDRPIQGSLPGEASAAVISFSGMGMATSGNYRNFHRDSTGNIISHTISPKTGRPVPSDILSATVVTRTAMEADGLATAFMAMGSKRSKELASSLRLPVMLILSDSTIWQTPSFEKMIVKPER